MPARKFFTEPQKSIFPEKELHLYLAWEGGEKQLRAICFPLVKNLNELPLTKKKTSQEWENIMFIRRRHHGTSSYKRFLTDDDFLKNKNRNETTTLARFNKP